MSLIVRPSEISPSVSAITETYFVNATHCPSIKPNVFLPGSLIASGSSLAQLVTDICYMLYRQTISVQWMAQPSLPAPNTIVWFTLHVPPRAIWTLFSSRGIPNSIRDQVWPVFRDYANRCNICLTNRFSYHLVSLPPEFSFGQWTDSPDETSVYSFTKTI